MSRRFVAFGLLGLAGMLLLPEPVEAAGGVRGGFGGIRGGAPIRGGFHGQFRGPLILKHHHPRAGLLRHGIGRAAIAGPKVAFPLPGQPKIHAGPARTHVAAPWSRMHRRHHHHHRHFGWWAYPITYGEDVSYFGVPYGPGETIPVYAPLPANDDDANNPPPAPRMAPRLTNAAGENQDACRSEKVTVPASEGEREITVVRC